MLYWNKWMLGKRIESRGKKDKFQNHFKVIYIKWAKTCKTTKTQQQCFGLYLPSGFLTFFFFYIFCIPQWNKISKHLKQRHQKQFLVSNDVPTKRISPHVCSVTLLCSVFTDRVHFIEGDKSFADICPSNLMDSMNPDAGPRNGSLKRGGKKKRTIFS